ncbi:hypothetical protein [Parasphingorhabdus sp.]|uniref:hypothetical protein n=1 Tax=Parasphingorhabdus sp. TaxID=2709688 RepID=UPI003A90E0CE
MLVLTVLLMPILIFAICFMANWQSKKRLGLKWWLVRVGLLPTVSVICAFYVMLTTEPVPLGYLEGRDPDTGFVDFVAISLFGVIAPLLIIAISITFFGLVAWKKTRK